MLKVTLHRCWDEVKLLLGRNDLLASSASDTIFLTWEWLSAWWKSYGAGKSLYVLATWKQHELLGVAPLYVGKVRRWGIDWNCLKLMGDGSNDSDYLDFVVRRGREHQVVGAFLDFLEAHRRDWDALELYATPDKSPCLHALLEVARQKSWKLASEPIPCATLTLPRRWEDYLQLLKPRFRSKLRSSLTILERHIQSVPRPCGTPEQLDQWLPILFDLHTRRWHKNGQPGVFGNQAKRNFYRDISHAALEKGWLAFHRLDWAERTLALQYGFLYRSRFFLLQEGYDPELEVLRPGLTLRGWLMRHWIESGVEEYDFLAGLPRHKMDWGAQQKLSLRVCLTPKRSSAWVFLGVPRLHEVVKDQVREMVPEALLSWRKERIAKRAVGTWAAPSEQRGAGRFGRVVRRVISRVYPASALGMIGRHLAARYALDPATGQSGRPSLRRRSTPICQILIYHRVNDDNDRFLPALSVDAFRAQMEFLAKHFALIDLDTIARGELPTNGQNYCVAVTFDDGYRDNYLNAFPILKRLGIPATIFLTTGYVDQGTLPWYDQISLALKLTAARQVDLRTEGGPEASLESCAERLRSMDRIRLWMRTLQTPKRLDCLQKLFSHLGVPAGLNLPNHMLKWEEVREMSRHQISIGAHTVTHPVLAKTPRQGLVQEILGSKKIIEDQLQSPVRHFAYPFGKPGEFNDEVKALVQQAGFETAVTTVPGYNRIGDDRLELKRFNPWEEDPGMFAFRLDWYRLVGVDPAQPNAESRLKR